MGFTVGLANGILNVVFGLIFAIYMLAGKEKLIAGVNRFCDCFFPESFNRKAHYVVTVTNDTCSRFIEGQCLDALCLGILSFIVLSIMRMPFALVIAVTLAITNMIPVIGGALGEAADGYLAGVSLIRSASGTLAAAAVISYVLPALLKIAVLRAGLSAVAAGAEIMGRGKEAAVVREAGEVIGIAVALICTASVLSVIAVGVFAGSLPGG